MDDVNPETPSHHQRRYSHPQEVQIQPRVAYLTPEKSDLKVTHKPVFVFRCN